VRILWYSNAPWNASGYGTQTVVWVNKLREMGHEVAVAAFHGLQGVPLNWNGITVLPGSSEDIWAQDLMVGHYQQWKADLMITLMDYWVLDAAKLRQGIEEFGMKIVPWQPVDCEPLGALDQRNLMMTGVRPIAMSHHGEKQMKEFSPWYIPHGIDTKNLWKPPTKKQRAESRGRGDFEDKFLIGMNAANQDPVRKGFGEQLLAFRLFADKHPDARMLIHTRRQTRHGIDFDRLIDVLKLQGKVHFGDQYLTSAGMTSSAELARWYGTLDLLTNCAYGEGFGLPVLEAQACGTPVAVTNCSSMTELCGSGWLIEGEFYWNAGHSAWWTRPSVQAILTAYEQAYERARDPVMRREARKFAQQYDTEVVARRYWEPFLAEIDFQLAEADAVKAASA
jgi:glycosyltransferase involved in cell wall biosynthesis